MGSSRRKEEIITVASRLFKEKGFTAVSVRDLAEEMGMKAASLYNHISSKQEILSSLILALAEDFTRSMERVLEENSTPIDQIESLIHVHIDITVNHSEALAALNNDWMHLQGQDLIDFVKMREDYEENFRKIIKKGMSSGDLKLHNPEVVLFSMLSTLRNLYIWYQKRGKLDVNILKRDMTAVLLRGVVS